MKVRDFIERLLEIEKQPTLYKWGKYLNKKQDKYLLCDCSGLIKGVFWGYPEKGKYASNGVPDINADTMIGKCSKVSTQFHKLPIGSLVWMRGHIGVHVGNGICVESSPIWENGVQCTFIKGSGYSNVRKLKERTWAKQGLFDKYVEYDKGQSTPTPQIKDNWVANFQKELNRQYNLTLEVDGVVGTKTKSACPTVKKGAKGNITRLIQERLNSVGFHISEDGDFGTKTYEAVKVFQKNRKLNQDGIVGKNTWNYLLSGKKY